MSDSTPDISAMLPDEETIRACRGALVDSLARPSRRRRAPAGTRRALLAVFALALPAAGVAWAVNGGLSARDMDFDAGVACYGQPSLHGSAAGVQAAADPVAKCGRIMWEGVVGRGEGQAPPHLVACTWEGGGGIAVLPGPDAICERLGLVPLPADYAAFARAHARAFRALFLIGEWVPGWTSGCTSPQEAAEAARRRLAKIQFPFPVGVEIHGDLPCAKEYAVADGKIAVMTSSAASAAENRYASRVDTAIRDLVEASGRGCIGPGAFLRRIHRDLAAAGMGGVAVSTVGDGRCVDDVFRVDADGSNHLEFFRRDLKP